MSVLLSRINKRIFHHNGRTCWRAYVRCRCFRMSIKLSRHLFPSSQQHDGGIYVLLLRAAAPKIRRPELPEYFNLGNGAISLIPGPHTLVHTLLLLITVSGPKRDCKVKLNMASFRVAILLHTVLRTWPSTASLRSYPTASLGVCGNLCFSGRC